MDACPDFIGVVNPPEADRVPDEWDLSTGSNCNPQNTRCMDACPDFIGVVNPPQADRLPLRGVGPTGRRLELEQN